MNWLKAIIGVVKTAAPIAANIVLPGAGSIVGGLMDEVLKDQDLGERPLSDQEKAEIIMKDPKLVAELKAKAIDLEATYAKEQTQNMAQVNQTIQKELVSGKWYQRAWRPFNGFMFPLAVIGNYIILPALWDNPLTPIPEVPASLWVVWAGILGVAVYGRNKEKQAAAGKSPAGGIVGGLLKKLIK